jgi:hypothetical protein
VTLTGTLLPPSDAEEAQLQALIDTVKRTSPDKARHDTTFDLDDLLTHLLEDDEVKSHVATRNNFACKDERARARGRAIVTLKLQSYRGLDFSRELLIYFSLTQNLRLISVLIFLIYFSLTQNLRLISVVISVIYLSLTQKLRLISVVISVIYFSLTQKLRLISIMISHSRKS